MTTQLPLQKVITILRENKTTDKEIGSIIETWTKLCFTRVYTLMMSEFSDEEMAEFEKMENQDEMQKKIKADFEQRYGKTTDAIATEFLTILAEEFLKEYEKTNTINTEPQLPPIDSVE